MQIIDYIDFKSIFEKIKKKQLEEYPTAKDYIDFLEEVGEPSHYVEEMYESFYNLPNNYDFTNSDNAFDVEVIDLENELLHIELSIGGNNATENGNDYWGYGWNYTVNLDDELFVSYSFENYS
jgi:hypothetical protein